VAATVLPEVLLRPVARLQATHPVAARLRGIRPVAARLQGIRPVAVILRRVALLAMADLHKVVPPVTVARRKAALPVTARRKVTNLRPRVIRAVPLRRRSRAR
jgi:hypothetical protein